ncbi:hypothetical protein H7347_02200 [Corynebacterium sp. zg-331]|nr:MULTISPECIES: hypothetical protein [unclassified Corynebacterium]MBC3185399.1 hypothetical protein [Corynebacterium sp. zg-331]
MDQITTYLVGGAFGLSMVLGAVFLTDEGVDPAAEVGSPAHPVPAASAW